MERLERIKDKIQDKEINMFYMFLNSLQKYVVEQKDDGLKVKEVRDKIYKEIYDVHMVTYEHDGEEFSASGKSDTFFLYTMKYILKNPNVVFDTYERIAIKDRKRLLDDSIEYEYNEDMIHNIIVLLNNVLKYQKKKFENTIDNLSDEDKEFLLNGICEMGKSIIKKENFENHVKKGYIRRLSKMISFLDELGNLQMYNDFNNRRLDKIGIKDELGYDYDKEGKKDYKITNVMDLKDEKALEKLSLEELTVLISFYINRVEKTTENIEKVLFVLEKRGLLGRFYRGENIEDKLTKENLELNLTQFKFLSDICDVALGKVAKYSDKKKGRMVFYNKDDIMDYIFPEDVVAYRQFIKSNDATLKADLKKDIIEMQEFSSYKNNLYYYKDDFMDIMMFHLLTSDKDVNWGYVDESEKTYNGENSIKNEYKNILIKADVKGFNNPIALHYDREDIKKFMLNFNGTTLMPKYIGAEDFFIEGKDKNKVYMSNYILMPMGSSRIKKLKKFASGISEDSIYYRYVKHLAWINNPKGVPGHLLNHGGFERDFVDLETGDVQKVCENVDEGR